MARGEAWHWSLRPKSDPHQLIGRVSLMKAENNNRGFWLGLPWQRLMSEAVEVITDYWFNELGFSVMRIPKTVVNTASRRLSEKNCRRWHVQIEFTPTLLAARFEKRFTDY